MIAHNLLLSALLVPCIISAAEPLVLFDGQSLKGWQGRAGLWRVEEGAITGEIKNQTSLDHNEWIFWDGEVNDFELELEYRITGGPSANSGIQVRCQRDANGVASGLQCDLDDGAEWLGRIYDEHGRALIMERGTRVSIAPDGRRWADPFAEPKSFQKIPKANDWNTYHIRASASRVETWVNGVFFGALDDHETKAAEYTGKLAFQLHSGPGPAKIQFRNIRLTDLGKTDLPSLADKTTAKESDVFQPVGDNGKLLNLGFENGSLEDWKAQGDAFEGQPIKGDTVSPRKPGQASRHAGEYWIGGYEPKHTDEGTGTLTSVPFKVTRPWASFLIGATTGDPGSVRVEIVEAATEKVFHTASGKGEEDMRREIVDMRPLQGKSIYLRLIDQGKSGWEHLNFDDFVFHNEPPAQAIAATGRQSQSPVLWHLRDNPAKPTAVANAEAQAVVAGMMLTHGFQAELIAAEPEVVQPIAFCIDARGRLWVLEGLSYPNKQPEGKGRDRISIFADNDGDGNFETRTVFAEGLNLASGIEVGFGGVWVGAAPQLLFFPDKNGDDQPDGPPQVLLDGWGYQDTHETLNSFIWGPDGWLYGCQGVFNSSLIGKPGTPDHLRLPMHAGVWRYHPVRHEFEIFSNGGSNQWGLDYNENGDFFMTHCRSFFGGGGTTFVIRNGHYWNQANAGYASFISNSGTDFAPDLKNYLPASALYDSGEGGAGKPGTTAIYGGHSHVGTMIYQGANWPETYRGHLFTHNLHGHQMNHQINYRSGSGYETMHGGADLMFTPDPRYIAVDLQSGPDGAVYIIDWCDQQHCHTPVEEKWDRSNGRIYRVSWAATYKPVKVDLTAMSDVELAKLQKHPDDWYRRQARRLLMERATTASLSEDALSELANDAGDLHGTMALRGLWALHQCGKLDATRLQSAVSHPDPNVRAFAIRIATETMGKPALPPQLFLNLAATDQAAQVRLALASALPAFPASDRWGVAEALAQHAEDKTDRFLPKVLWSGLATVAGTDWPRALKIAGTTPIAELADDIRWFAATSADGCDALAAETATLSAEQVGRIARIAAFALRDQQSLPPPIGLKSAFAKLATIKDRAVLDAVDQLAAIFGDKEVLARMRGVLADAKADLVQRKSALALLRRTGDPEAVPVFAGLLDQDAFRAEIIPLLGRSDDPSIATALLQRYEKFNPADQNSTLAALTSRPALALALVKAMAAGQFEKKTLTAVHIRQIRNLGNAELNTLLEKTWGKFNPTSDTAKATVAKYKKLFSEAPLWAYEAGRGREVFTKVCSACHNFGGGDPKIGPDLGGAWRNGIDYFLENITDPNAVIGEDFQLNIITKNDGSVVAGAIAKDSDTTLTVKTLTEAVNIPKADIKTREKLAQSFMPPGLLEALSEREALELLKFLTSQP